MGLRRILAEEGILKTDFFDSHDAPVDADTLAAARKAISTGTPRKFGEFLAEKFGPEEAAPYLDGLGRVLRELMTELGVEIRDFRTEADKEISRFLFARDEALIAASPWKVELMCISKEMQGLLTPKSVKSLRVKTKRKRVVLKVGRKKVEMNQYVGVQVDDPRGITDSPTKVFTEEIAKRRGTTLKKLLEALDALGAKSLDKGPVKAWQDDANWTY